MQDCAFGNSAVGIDDNADVVHVGVREHHGVDVFKNFGALSQCELN
jgi:hypothetical protein